MTTQSIYDTLSNIGVQPFTNGSEAMDWMESNCNRCQRSWCCRNNAAEPPDFQETEKLTNAGSECIGAFALGFGFVSGYIPNDIAVWIGADIKGKFCHMPVLCRHFTADPEYTPPTPPDPNQLKLF
jgi:hypothetical protein